MRHDCLSHLFTDWAGGEELREIEEKLGSGRTSRRLVSSPPVGETESEVPF